MGLAWVWGWIFWAAQAEKISYPTQKLNAAGLHRLNIIGVKGRVRLTGKNGPVYRLNIRHSKKQSEDWHLLVERRKRTLHLEVFSVAYGREWRRHVSQDRWPEFDIEITGPSIETVVSWREGLFRAKKWTRPLKVSLLKGDVDISDGQSRLDLHGLNLVTMVKDFRGDVVINGEKGSVDLERVKGSVKAHWLSGAWKLRKVNGRVELDGRRVNFNIVDGRGEWQVVTPHGRVRTQNFQGRFKGQGESGRWNIGAATPAEVDVINETGPVKVKWRGGAKVFLTSNKGKILSDIKDYELDPDGRHILQTTVGKKPWGQVFVRTQSGAITLKQ